MTHLVLTFLGGFEAAIDAKPLTAFGSDKVRALLAFLAIESQHPQRRAKLAAMFWPDLSEKRAAHNLSQSLLRLRTALRDKKAPAGSAFLTVTTQYIQFNPTSSFQLDVLHFRELLKRCNEHTHPEAAECGVCAQWRAQAAALYQGDFLAGFFVPDSVTFEEWRLVQQEALHRRALETFGWLAVYHARRGELDRVQTYARRQIALEPWREEAHVQLMVALAQSGQRAAALHQYEQYRNTLAAELGIRPAAAVTALVERIRSGAVPAQGGVSADSSPPVWLSHQGERRQITALACRLSTPDAGGEGDDQAALCERYCEGIYHRFGGRRTPRQGNVCLVYFGYPQAYEDAARRAVYAGLGVAAAVTGRDTVQIGIDTGVVTVGAKRSERWQDRDLIGNTFDIARDCQRLAQPGQVVISENTRRLVHGSFDLQPLAPPAGEGTGRPVPVYRVASARDVPSRLDWLAQTQRLTPFTGRGAELERLAASLEQLREGTGQAVFVRGQPGIGKSRLVWELKQRTGIGRIPAPHHPRPIVWLAGQCLPHYQNTSLFPVTSLLEQLLAFQAADSPAARRDKLIAALAQHKLDHASDIWLLSIWLGLPTDAPPPATITVAHREQMRALFITLLHRRAAEQPLVIVIEDLQWADPSTLAWLGASANTLLDMPCLTLLTARPGFTPAWLSPGENRPNVQQITLGPLPSDQAEKMVADLAGESVLDDGVRHHIVAKTDGIPLFVEELTKAFIEHSVFRSATDAPDSIPLTLLDLLVTRLDRLGAAKETAQWAAVLGRDFAYPVLQACTGFDEQRLQADLARLIEAELVAPGRTAAETAAPAGYAFRHALIQEAAYASLLSRTRRHYHHHIAAVLTTQLPHIGETRPEVVAHHYARAGEPTQAVTFWILAGERAAAQGATLEARTFFDRALEGVDSAEHAQRWRALLGREAVLNLREERAAQKQDIEALLELVATGDDDSRRAQARLREAQYALRQKDFPAMLQATNAAIAAAGRAGDRTSEVRGLAYKVTALAYIGEWAAAHHAVEETLSKLPAVQDDVVQAYLLGDLGFYFSRIGDASRALGLMMAGAQAAQRAGDRHKESRLNVNIGFVNAQLGRYAAARAAFEAGLALARAIGDKAAQTSHRYNLSYVLWCLGEGELAQEIGEQALQEFQATGHNTLGHASCLSYLGIYCEAAGDNRAAAAYLAQARALYAAIGVKSYRMEAQAVEARVLLALGHPEAAREMATTVWEYVREHGTGGMDFPARVYVCLAGVLAGAGGGRRVGGRGDCGGLSRPAGAGAEDQRHGVAAIVPGECGGEPGAGRALERAVVSGDACSVRRQTDKLTAATSPICSGTHAVCRLRVT